MKKVLLSGGLGNQMFQYAFFESLKASGISASIDTSLFLYTKMHNGFELSKIFDITEDKTAYSKLHRLWVAFLRKYKPVKFVYADILYTFCADVYKSKASFLSGDWISEQYFSEIRHYIVELYTFKNISHQNLIEANKMQKCNSVSLHIRRGDYLNLPNYCVCDEEYYKNSISFIKNTIENPFFFVFSNEPDWCESFMKKFNVNFIIVDWNQGKDSYQDMYLMTQCKHNIIANSTFSWWGAWLNQNKNKIVVAPKYWFRNSDIHANCPYWHIIDNINNNKQYE